MKKIALALFLAIPTLATAGGEAGFAGATEATQILNNIQLADSYAKQVMQYSTQLQQFEAQLRNMALNPTSITPSDVTRVINGIGTVMQAGQAIGGTMAKIDANFAAKFGSPLAGSYSDNFKTWTQTSQDTLGAAMRAAGLHRDGYATDAAALIALYNKAQSSQGTVAAVQTLSEINVTQIQQTQKLQDLIATQNVAAGTYMASQTAKEQATQDANDKVWTLKKWDAPKMRPGSHY